MAFTCKDSANKTSSVDKVFVNDAYLSAVAFCKWGVPSSAATFAHYNDPTLAHLAYVDTLRFGMGGVGSGGAADESFVDN